MTRALRALIASTAIAAPLAAQADGPVLRGVVLGESGDPVPFAMVVIRSPLRRQFADDRGRFVFTGMQPGTWQLEVRQVGFAPFDTTLTIGTVSAGLRVTLSRIAVELPAITVTSDFRCTAPGPPAGAGAEPLQLAFTQLRFNAERYAMLADSFPWEATMWRNFSDVNSAGQIVVEFEDTTTYRSNVRWTYRPGQVVTRGRGPGGSIAQLLNLPTLPALADSAFHATHCFRYGGLVDHEGERFALVEFKAAERLRTSDVDGDVLLDPVTFQVRRVVVRLTRVRNVMPGADSMVAVATFRELYPYVLVPERVVGTTWLRPGWRGTRVVEQAEVQRLMRVHFLRPLPTEADTGTNR